MENFKKIQSNYILCQPLKKLGITAILTMRPKGYGIFKEPLKILQENYHLLNSTFNLSNSFNFMRQKHTNIIKDITQSNFEIHSLGKIFDNCDGLLTHNHEVLVSTYADCTPILLYDAKQKIQINIHSGWKGTLSKILFNALEILTIQHQSQPNDIYCMIGPHLLFNDFEVDIDVYSLYKEAFPDEKYFQKLNNGKYKIDTLSINKSFLDDFKIPKENRFFLEESTLNSALYHSFRTDKENYHQMALISMIDPM